jgi:DNA-binding response OmpR family regulator
MSDRLLLVEDDPETLDMLTIGFELREFVVIVAKNGVEGIERACTQLPDVIITDLWMPLLNGIEMIRRLRSRPESASVPIIAITGYGNEFAEEATRAGADKVLTKPVYPEFLHLFIKDLLGRRKRLS